MEKSRENTANSFGCWLQQATHMPVVEISDGEQLRIGVVYLVPPGMSATQRADMFHIGSYDRGSGPHTTIGLAPDLLARRKAVLETGLAVSVRVLKDRVALLVRLIGQSKKNPKTYEFLSTGLAALKLDLGSIQRLLDLA
jgi:hypothetical protein